MLLGLYSRQSTAKPMKWSPSKRWRASTRIGKSVSNWGKSRLWGNSIIPISSSSNRCYWSQRNCILSFSIWRPTCTKSMPPAKNKNGLSHSNRLSMNLNIKEFAVSIGKCSRSYAQERIFPSGFKAVKLANLWWCSENMWLRTCEINPFSATIHRLCFNEVVFAIWYRYRSPELLLRSTNYNSPVDVFAFGCIAAELYNLAPLFPGNNDMDQLNKIVKALGTPDVREWAEGYKLAKNICTHQLIKPITFQMKVALVWMNLSLSLGNKPLT